MGLGWVGVGPLYGLLMVWLLPFCYRLFCGWFVCFVCCVVGVGCWCVWVVGVIGLVLGLGICGVVGGFGCGVCLGLFVWICLFVLRVC